MSKQSTDTGKITFLGHKEQTARDCEGVAEMLVTLAKDVREGNMAAFEGFWFQGGTEEGDARILELRERLLLRYMHRQESLV